MGNIKKLMLQSDDLVAIGRSMGLKVMARELASVSSVEVDGTNHEIKDFCNSKYDNIADLLQLYNLAAIKDAERIQMVASHLEDLDINMKNNMIGYSSYR